MADGGSPPAFTSTPTSDHVGRAHLLLGLGHFDKAEAEARAALVDRPSNAEAQAVVALALFLRNRRAEGLSAAERAVGAAPQDPYPHFVLATLRLELGDLKAARTAITEALRLRPHEPDYWLVMAQLEAREGQFAAAREAVERGLEVNPLHVGCSLWRVRSLLRERRLTEATEGIESLLARQPDHAEVLALAGWILLVRGQPRSAAEHFRLARRLEPMLPTAGLGIWATYVAWLLPGAWAWRGRWELWRCVADVRNLGRIRIGCLAAQAALIVAVPVAVIWLWRVPTLRPVAFALGASIIGVAAAVAAAMAIFSRWQSRPRSM